MNHAISVELGVLYLSARKFSESIVDACFLSYSRKMEERDGESCLHLLMLNTLTGSVISGFFFFFSRPV